jgi:hypothetical protein
MPQSAVRCAILVAVFAGASCVPSSQDQSERPSDRAATTSPAGAIVVEARLLRLTPTPDPRAVLPYRQAMVAHTYEVQKVIAGNCGAKRIMVAHWAIREGKPLPVERKKGQTYRLVLEQYRDNPRTRGQKLVMDSDEFDLPLYYNPPEEAVSVPIPMKTPPDGKP